MPRMKSKWALNLLKSYLYGIWAFNLLKNYLYGYALSHKNKNNKMKRLKSILMAYNSGWLIQNTSSAISIKYIINSDQLGRKFISDIKDPVWNFNSIKKQIFPNKYVASICQFKVVLPTCHRHVMRSLNSSGRNYIKTGGKIMGKIQILNYWKKVEKKLIKKFTEEQKTD